MLPAIPTPIPMPFAQNGERRAIPETNTTPGSADASWATGFPPVTRINKQAGGKPPYGLDFQGIFHTICEHLFFAQSGNTPPWVGAGEEQPGLNYLQGAIVQGSDGEIYMALRPSGPDAPSSAGAGFVGPVDPVGDESGHWIALKLLFAGTPNTEKVITESCEWAAPVAGWYRIQMCGGGQGCYAHSTSGAFGCYSSAPGGRIDAFRWLEKGETVSIVIGAGGIPVTNAQAQQPYNVAVFNALQGGDTHFGDLVARGGIYTGADLAAGEWVNPGVGFYHVNASMYDFNTPNTPGLRGYGQGGGGRIRNDGLNDFRAGTQGVVILQYHDPDLAAGPKPVPALLSARRLGPARGAVQPVTVSLYDPETGQGSVWKAEDEEAKLAEGLVSEEAWTETCAARAAEEYDAWLADPETEAERFEMLRVACEARLTSTDKLTQPDYPLSESDRAAVFSYRKAIRELNHQPGAPWDGGGEATPWPEMPVVSKETAAE